LFQVVHEDNDLLVINKPAGLVCHPTKGDVFSSLISRVRLYLGGAPDNARIATQADEVTTASLSPCEERVGKEPERGAIHLINRLDRETSGLVLVARNSITALELRRLWENGAVTKRYFAIVHGHVVAQRGEVDAPLGPDEESVVAIKNKVRIDGSPARTEFEVLKTFERGARPFSLLAVHPTTGRKHQIRIHLAHYGHPIVGDKIYGGDEQCYLDFVQSRLSDEQRTSLILPNHALHAQSISFEWRGRHVAFEVEPESSFTQFISERG
jgi:23S rRNA pseudouridine1911/1915/1917 synthase